MRVGIFALTVDAEAGGGFTLERDIVDALAGEAGEAHDLFLFSFTRSDADEDSLPLFRIEQPKRRRRIIRALGQWRRIASKLFGGSMDSNWALEPAWLREGVAASGADLVICLSPSFSPGPDVPYFTIVWDLQHRLQPWFPEVTADGQWISRDSAYERALGQASRVIVGTAAGKREAMGFYRVPEENIRILPHPTPTFSLETGERSEPRKGTKKTRPYLFYPAQFWAHKDHVTALRALKVLRERGRDLGFVFCGSDPGNRAWVEAECSQLGLSDFVSIEGFVSRERLVSLYQEALALVYTSWFGPENLPPLEAFALGCPVIATNVAGSEEQLADAALLFDVGDELALASAVERLLGERDLRKRLIEAGHERALSFTARHFARGLLEIVDEFEPARRCWAPARNGRTEP